MGETTATRIIIILLKYFVDIRLDFKMYKIIIVKSKYKYIYIYCLKHIMSTDHGKQRD